MSRTLGGSPAARLAASLLLLGCLTAPVAGCGGDNLTGTMGGGGLTLSSGGGSSGSVGPALVGSWFHLVYVPDSTGSVRTSETTLTFNSDGTLTRSVVARVLSFGFADQVISTGTWRATATTVSITITATNVGGTAATTGTPTIDSTQAGGTFGLPLTSLPPLAPNPPFGTTASSAAAADSVGTSTGTTTYTYRIETTSQGTTLLLNGVPFVRLASTP